MGAYMASLFSTRLAAIRVRIPDLGSGDAHLLIDANGRGPLADMLHYVQTSPVGALLGNSLALANGSGPAILDLALDIPLQHARDTTVKGGVTFANNDLALMPPVPPLTRLNGRLQFNEHGFALDNVGAAFVGGHSTFNAVRDSDGTQVISAAGTVSAACDALPMFPASVARLRIWTDPTTAAPSASVVWHRVHIPSAAAPETIHVDLMTHRRLYNRFRFESAQELEIKGKGRMQVYQLTAALERATSAAA